MQATTLEQYAQKAIQKHFKKTIKHQAAVLNDRDPEEIHQMRVGLRRLRTAVKVFETAIALPPEISDAKIGKLARSLGKVRDLDVLQAWFQTYQQGSDPSVSEALQPILNQLQKQRQRRFARLKKALKGAPYQTFVEGFQGWLKQPQYEAIAVFPVVDVLPDILLPLISELLLHPGWLVATRKTKQGQFKPIAKIRGDRLEQILEEEAEPLHELRKQIKQIRYQTEFFADFYSADYQERLHELRQAQELLGQLQDGVVLSDFLADHLGKTWTKILPDLAAKLQQEHHQIWRSWQPIQAQYLDPDFRHQLRLQIMSPTASRAADTPLTPDTP